MLPAMWRACVTGVGLTLVIVLTNELPFQLKPCRELGRHLASISTSDLFFQFKQCRELVLAYLLP